MMKPKSLLLLVFLCGITYLNAQTHVFYFPKDKSNLEEAHRQKLRSIQKKNENYKGKIEITGFTDSDASDRYNDTLGMQRAISIGEYFQRLNPNAEIAYISKGEKGLINADSTPEEQAKNRRVTFSFIHNIPKNQVNNYKPSETFFIHPWKDTILVCQEGTVIAIPAFSFDTKNTRDAILVKVKEYYSKEEIVKAKLTTETVDGKILESKGMIYMEASQSGNRLELDQGKEIGVVYTTKTENDGFGMFYGIEDGDNGIQWVPQPTNSQRNGFDIITWRYEKVNQSESMLVHEFKGDLAGTMVKNEIYTMNDARYTKIGSNLLEKLNSSARNLLLTSDRMGWLNCDDYIFINDPTELIVDCDYSGGFTLITILQDKKSLMAPSFIQGQQYTFRNLDIGWDIVLIGYFSGDHMDDEPKLAVKKIKAGTDRNVSLEFENTSEEEIKEILASF